MEGWLEWVWDKKGGMEEGKGGSNSLHRVDGADVDDDDHVERLLQVADELELLGQALTAALPLPGGRRDVCGLAGMAAPAAGRATAACAGGVVVLAIGREQLPGRGARARIVMVHRSPRFGSVTTTGRARAVCEIT